MQDCPIRKQLVSQWCDAVNQLSIGVDRLEAYVTILAQFDQEGRAVEFARIAAENARIALNEHSSEHKCERPGARVANVIPAQTCAIGESKRDELAL